VEKLGQLNQRDKQFVRYNIQKNLFFCGILFILVCFHNTWNNYKRKIKVENTRTKFSILPFGVLQQKGSKDIKCKKI